MPANLTAMYLKAERAFRQAGTPADELRCLQDMLREIPKHKGTDKLQAELKQKISKAKVELEKSKSAKKGFRVKIPSQGAGRVMLIGGANAGKSSLLAKLTRATPEVAAYPYTTREPQIGMMLWEDVFVQLVDTPPITVDLMDPYMQGLIRGADLVLLVVDISTDEGIEQAQDVMDRLNQTRTRLGRTSYLDRQDVGLSFTQTYVVANKSDVCGNESDGNAREGIELDERLALLDEFCPLDFDRFVVSCNALCGLRELRTAIYRSLDLVRVYTKSPYEKELRYEDPFTIRRGETLLDVAVQVHEDLARDLKFARVWGSEVHDGTQVTGDYVPRDRDVVEIHV